MADTILGVIGGSGLYEIEELELIDEVFPQTPFGRPSDPLRIGRFPDGSRLVFLSRHGRGHRFLPGEVPARANIWALKSLGVRAILSVSAVGSLREELAPTHLVVPDQLIDRTHGRAATFFGGGIVGHVAFADPFCDALRRDLLAAARGTTATVHDGGIYVCMEGPAFSTRAESELHRSWQASVIGMTALPEAKLAREAEICFATLALVTDYDCWHEEEETVSVSLVMETMKKNTAAAKAIIRTLAARFSGGKEACSCESAAAHAVMTDRAAMPAETREKLSLFYAKYWS